MGLGFAQIASIKGSRSRLFVFQAALRSLCTVFGRENLRGVNKLTLNASPPCSFSCLSFFISFFFSFRATPVNLSFDSVDFFRTREQAILPRSRDNTWKRSKNRIGFYCSRHQSFVVWAFLSRSNYEWILFYLFFILYFLGESENRRNFAVKGWCVVTFNLMVYFNLLVIH